MVKQRKNLLKAAISRKLIPQLKTKNSKFETLKLIVSQVELIMQNKPDFTAATMNSTLITARPYENLRTRDCIQNKPNQTQRPLKKPKKDRLDRREKTGKFIVENRAFGSLYGFKLEGLK